MTHYAVVGLGYVGLGLAAALAKKHIVYAYDINKQRIKELQAYTDKNEQVEPCDLKNPKLHFTDCLEDIRGAVFYIVSVATPAYFYEMPDLEPLIKATKQLGAIIKRGDIVVFESTVYPGATEEVCLPILEEVSGLQCGKDFHIGYSPERINPGDPIHHLDNTTKIIGAQDQKTLDAISHVYHSICDTVYPVSSIRAAEAVKVLENTQRDVNIALMNEFSKIMHALDVDVHEILEAAKTKWSYMPFKPGFVGGHCISIDPHYLAFKAKRMAVAPDLILTARKVNDSMPDFVIQSMLKLLFKHHVSAPKVRVGIFGIGYKENVHDMRNSLALKLVKELRGLDIECYIHDPYMETHSKVKDDLELMPFDAIHDLHAAIIVVGHDFYKQVGFKAIMEKCNSPYIMMDIPNLFYANHVAKKCVYWSL
jgi:UDP-N-acetyl-D-galactosamine dehydrogenase